MRGFPVSRLFFGHRLRAGNDPRDVGIFYLFAAPIILVALTLRLALSFLFLFLLADHFFHSFRQLRPSIVHGDLP